MMHHLDTIHLENCMNTIRSSTIPFNGPSLDLRLLFYVHNCPASKAHKYPLMMVVAVGK